MDTSFELLWSNGPLAAFALGLAVGIAALGFAGGLIAAPAFEHWRRQRARRHVAELCAIAAGDVERARQSCTALVDLGHAVRTWPRWEQFEHSREQLRTLFDALKQLGTQGSLVAPSGLLAPLVWCRDSVDPVTSLPDRAAFERSLEVLERASSTQERFSSVILVRVDKLPAMRQRVGGPATDELLRRLASVLIREVHDADLVARLADDEFGILVPDVSPVDAAVRALAVREAVRSHRFRAGEHGPEVLLTASFGCASWLPHERASLVLERAAEGMSRSHRQGRNQLHLHDGRRCVLARVD